ncbi:MAG: non-ribosomal peptide synthetase, partial [bacterium]|nr:non-ribosomal peptide synthetase [bacterium]
TATVLVLRIRKEFNVQISMVEVLTTPTIKQQAAHIDGNRDDSFAVRDNNLVLLKQSTNKANEKHLFLIHDSRGGVEMFIQFCHHLDSRFSCWGIKPDVPEHSLPFHTTIETVAARYIEKIKKVQPNGPYLLAGWSLGGVIAFEMARQLEQMNEDVRFLGLMDSRPPLDSIAEENRDR